jgi:hypothetical protein
MVATPTAMPRRPAARKDAKQAARFNASRGNSSFKIDVEEIIVIAYVRRRKQKLKKKQKLWVHPFVVDRPTCGMFCKIYSDLRKYPDTFFSYLRLSIGSFDELLTHFFFSTVDRSLPPNISTSSSQFLFLKSRFAYYSIVGTEFQLPIFRCRNCPCKK